MLLNVGAKNRLATGELASMKPFSLLLVADPDVLSDAEAADDDVEEVEDDTIMLLLMLLPLAPPTSVVKLLFTAATAVFVPSVEGSSEGIGSPFGLLSTVPACGPVVGRPTTAVPRRRLGWPICVADDVLNVVDESTAEWVLLLKPREVTAALVAAAEQGRFGKPESMPPTDPRLA
jgi:hypothetical protein